MNIIPLKSKKWEIAEQNGLSKQEVFTIVTNASEQAAALLPPLSPYINISIYPDGSDVDPEIGDSAWTWDDERVEMYFDPELPHGADTMRTHLHDSVFHELNHAARRLIIPFEQNPLEFVVSEGTATVFERDNTDSAPRWAQYEDEATMLAWLEEIKALPPEKDRRYLFDHPDGRKWIMYKTGTWVVDRLVKSGKATLNELTVMPADEVIALIS